MYQYPARLASTQSKTKSHPVIQVDLRWEDKYETEIRIDITAEDLVMSLGSKYGFDQDFCKLCCIKTVGEASFLLGHHLLSDYAFIQEEKVPKLVILAWDSIEVDMANEAIYIKLEKDIQQDCKGHKATSPSGGPPSPKSLPRKTSLTSLSLSNLAASSPLQFATIHSSNLDKPFKILIESVNYGTDVTYGKHEIQVGLFHGNQILCPLKTLSLNKSFGVEVGGEVKFDISLANVPRMAKLCFGLFERRKGTAYPLAWVNTNVFDYKAKLRRRDSLHFWRYFLNDIMPTHEMLSPLRTNITNPSTRDSTSIVLVFHDYGYAKIQYPVKLSLSNGALILGPINENGNGKWSRICKLYGQELQTIAKQDPLHELTVQEKDLIWTVREYCLHYFPTLLPRIIDCVNYANQQQVAEIHRLIESWPALPPETALQLFDYAYPDENVRRFAVRCLRQASDDTINSYLLQLAQALKHESYFQCDLVEFLIERALKNQHIGHHLFWELKAEMSSPTIGLFYGLILEAYLGTYTNMALALVTLSLV